MATKIADLNAMLTMDTTSFTEGSTKVAAAAKNMHNDLAKTTGDTVRSGNATARAFTQIGFAIQDFHSQIGTRGIGGAISAVTNNVQMLGSAFGPMGMAITAVGGAVAGIAIPALIEFMTNTKKATAELNTLGDEWDKWIAKRQSTASFERSLGKMGAGTLSEGMDERRARVEANRIEQNRLINAANMARQRGDEQQVNMLLERRMKLEEQSQQLINEGVAMRKQFEIASEREAADTRMQIRRSQMSEEEKIIDDMNKEQARLLKLNQSEERDLAIKEVEAVANAKRKLLSDTNIWKQDIETAQQAINSMKEKIAQQATSRGSQAFIGGTQESASFLNRVTSGTRTEGDVLKKQLRVQEDMLKELRDNKPVPVASI